MKKVTIRKGRSVKKTTKETGRTRASAGVSRRSVSGLQERLAKAENVLRSCAAPMLLVDRDLIITAINDAALSAMGYSRERLKAGCHVLFSRRPPSAIRTVAPSGTA
ncbi:MAG: PAS domain-containing protein [Nitrospiraceae bacterium]|nr:PAS domain-containing protein [Nitrospiraceae bacterium]